MTQQMIEAGRTVDQIPALDSVSFPEGIGIKASMAGKVRDVFEMPGGDLVLVTTDRISAFDRVLGTVAGKGQVLNELSAWWFSKMADIIPNHVIAVPDPNVTVAKKLTPVPVEVIVRGVITGVTDTSLWVNYSQAQPDSEGYREVYGIRFPPGLKKNDILPEPVITPTTKATGGAHDEKLTEREIVSRGLVDPKIWEQVRTASVLMFQRAQDIARERGFLLVDTKMEFGTDDTGAVYIMDELFTPDSSRYWLAATQEARQQEGQEPDNYDKEYLRIAYKAMGYGGQGSLPDAVPQAIGEELLRRYVSLYEGLTGGKFIYPTGDPALRVQANMEEYLIREMLRHQEQEKREPQVVILMGSGKDMDHAAKIREKLADFGILAHMRVASAHKTARDVLALIEEYDSKAQAQTVYIAVAGRSNALGGMIAGETTNPVISCPPKGSNPFTIFSSLEMPSDIPTAVIIEPESAALFAAEIFAGTRPDLAARLTAYKALVRDTVRRDDDRIAKGY